LFRAAQAGASSTLTLSLVEGFKLIASALIGVLVTVAGRSAQRDRPMTPAMEQAQVLLCVSGAMMMIVIGNSLARAFGIAGAASIIRFRTPIDDPRDITVLFLLMALGMATGLGAYAVAGLGTLFLLVFLAGLNRFGRTRQRTLHVDLVAAGPEFPTDFVQGVFGRHGMAFEPREVVHGDTARVRYLVTLDATLPLQDLTTELIRGGRSGLRAVAWEPGKKRAAE
jgi:hypothetical protein